MTEPHRASSIVDATRRASSRSDVGHLPHSRPNIEVTTDFRQWYILSGRGKVSTKRRSLQMRAINMRLITSFSDIRKSDMRREQECPRSSVRLLCHCYLRRRMQCLDHHCLQ
ncbi:BQ5605_C002g01600 [Microbotryum silenes-dioicae]|uniref:BQ5605_C002g01600 protein n=1 Tax=Microbotryum silenes-dioicae TaxID=796604 RepID=A0A2X0M3L8_9BASI|nr:BQ5605_C002g01600 [Microbotryum silenes-dioicae]